MNYTKIAPLGKRAGVGTFETMWQTEKYATIEEAIAAEDYVCIDFVKGDDGRIYFEFYHSKYPELALDVPLMIQHFKPDLGIDTRDDDLAMLIGNKMLENPGEAFGEI